MSIRCTKMDSEAGKGYQMKTLFLLLAFFVLTFFSQAGAATYWVSPGGTGGCVNSATDQGTVGRGVLSIKALLV